MADYAYDTATGKEFNVKEFMDRTSTAMLEAYNPAGGSDLWSALTPTALDIPSEIARNKSWSGGKIKPDFNASTPEDIKYFESLRETKTGKAAVSLTELLQSKSGISISPANIKYAFDGYIGGVGRAVSKTVNTITGILGNKPAPIDEYPMVSRFYRQRTQEEVEQGKGAAQPEIKGMIEGESREKFKLKEDVRPIYEGVQKLVKEGKDAEAQSIVDGLSDKEYEAYKSIKASNKTRENNILDKKMQPVVLQVKKLDAQGKGDQAQSIVDKLSDDEYKAYKRAKKQLGFE
jgi:hypothetical protein